MLLSINWLKEFIDLNVPLITNARLASAFIYAFCTTKLEDIGIKAWGEY